MAKTKCNFQCYKDGTCPYSDCITDEITTMERLIQDNRDRSYTSYGIAVTSKSYRAKHRHNVIVY